MSPIEFVSFLADIAGTLSFAAAILGAVVAYNSFKDSKKRKATENAVRLAECFQHDILSNATCIISILEDTDFTRILKQHFDINNVNDFTLEEFKRLSGEDHLIEKLRASFEKIDPYKIANAFFVSADPSTLSSPLVAASLERHNKGDSKLLYILLDTKISDLLNQLEWFAMNFRTQIADEGVVYQTLHQVYRTLVMLLYFHICRHNKSLCDKFYTNIIWLFGKWRDRFIEQQKKERSKSAKKEDEIEYSSPPVPK